jgi:hypothetical protein
MMWKSFLAGAFAKEESRTDIFDMVMGSITASTMPDDDSSDGGIHNIKRLTADKFNALPPDKKREIYDDIMSRIKIPKIK